MNEIVWYTNGSVGCEIFFFFDYGNNQLNEILDGQIIRTITNSIRWSNSSINCFPFDVIEPFDVSHTSAKINRSKPK